MTVDVLKWGFGYQPGEKGLAPINARVETAEDKFTFREAWEQRWCIVPADGRCWRGMRDRAFMRRELIA
jgi:putative SOS response-associated peptidase YedK